MITYTPETYHVPLGIVVDPTDPHPTPPDRSQVFRAADVVVHHISEQCHEADQKPTRRNPHLILGLILVDLGGPALYFPTLADLVEDWPQGGEFPTETAADNYYYDVRKWLMANGYGGTK